MQDQRGSLSNSGTKQRKQSIFEELTPDLVVFCPDAVNSETAQQATQMTVELGGKIADGLQAAALGASNALYSVPDFDMRCVCSFRCMYFSPLGL